MKTVSIRELVGYVLRGGDIDTRASAGDRTEEGNEVHRLLQGEYTDLWEKEVHFKKTFEAYDLSIQGRADGIYDNRMVHEIKSTRRKIKEWVTEGYDIHWAQAYCYALILAEREQLETVDVLLTYYNLQTEERLDLKRVKTSDQLQADVLEIIKAYALWHDLQVKWAQSRSEALTHMQFPYGEYRAGQRKLAAAVYTAMRDNFIMLAEAPTGVGKTISTLFPTLKAMSEDRIDKIFYLTAKTVARTVAEDAAKHMRQSGGRLKTVTLTAKDKICFTTEKKCNPEDCSYAKGHYDRINEALIDAFHTQDHMDREAIIFYAEKHRVCPFEYSFDIASYSDLIIGDYNYVFDPIVKMQRFFMEVTERYAFLVDEGHNLPSRARDMYSAQIVRDQVLQLRRAFPPKSAPYKELGKLNKSLSEVFKGLETEALTYRTEELPSSRICSQVRKSFETAVTYLADTEGFELQREEGELLASYYRFDHLSELFNEGYVWMTTTEGSGTARLMCIDPSELLKECYKDSVGTVIFSATMAPYDYYEEILGLQGCKKLILDSPFPKENRAMLLGSGIDTRLRARAQSYDKICHYIEAFVEDRISNYLVFFPSYEYMRIVGEKLEEIKEASQHNWSIAPQKPGMTEAEKVSYLEFFERDCSQTVIGLAVLGGSFSEGIDLVGNRLEGVALVGFGTPFVSAENSIIQQYYEGRGKDGYTYAFVYPSINKVVQAVGRLIRTETDRGMILLMDDRYVSPSFRQWLPVNWHIERMRTPEAVAKYHKAFWSESEGVANAF